MRFERRIGGLVVGAIAGALTAPIAAVAATGTGPTDIPATDPGLESWIAFPVVFLALVVGTLALAIVRPSTRRPIAALAIFVAVGFVGLLMMLVGLFSDFSGRHQVNWGWVAIGAAVVGGGLILSVWIARGARRRPA